MSNEHCARAGFCPLAEPNGLASVGFEPATLDLEEASIRIVLTTRELFGLFVGPAPAQKRLFGHPVQYLVEPSLESWFNMADYQSDRVDGA